MKTIEKMAEEVGLYLYEGGITIDPGTIDIRKELERFAALVRTETIEEVCPSREDMLALLQKVRAEARVDALIEVQSLLSDRITSDNRPKHENHMIRVCRDWINGLLPDTLC